MRKAVDGNVGWAKNELFDLLWKKNDSNLNLEMISIAFNYSQEGNPGAMARLGRAYRDGKGVSKNLTEAAYWMNAAAQKGLDWAPGELFDILWITNTEESLKEMIRIGEQFSEKRPTVKARLAKAYRDGKGVPKDLVKAAALMREATNSGVDWAPGELFDILWSINTDASLKEMIEVGVKYSPVRATLEARMARAYRDGKGVVKDLDKASLLMCDAASKGVSWAKYEYCDILCLIGTEDSDRILFSYVSKYAEDGDIEMLGRLARLFLNGRGTERDIESAKYWYKKASDQKLSWAMVEYQQLTNESNIAKNGKK